MWVRTQEDELVNLRNIEYIRLEEGEEADSFELRAYAFGWEPDEGEDQYYPLAMGPNRESVEAAMDRLVAALSQGAEFLDLRTVWPEGNA